MVLAAALAPLLGGCDEGQGPSTGLGEPMMTTGQFIPGDLPGTPAPNDDGGGSSSPDASTPPLTVLVVGYNTTEIPAGANNQTLNGTVTSDTTAIGMRIEGMGTGYWVVPAGVVDPSNPGQAAFGTTAGFSTTIPGGDHNLLFVAIGPSGRGGVQYPVPFCFDPLIPDNGHACHPGSTSHAIPATVLTLQWDANFDLDLHVVLANGDDINPKNPYGMDVEAGARNMIDSNIPHIDRDSIRNCAPDGLRQEDVIFLQPMPHGTTTVYVDPYAACGQAATRFKFTLWQRSGTCDTCQMVQSGSPIAGEVLSSQVTGGVVAPLKIDQINVN
ncbi:MAG: hypothetical protein ACRENE_32990 [Polyangiaceae bacterium]